jgi:hypothetical protein
MSKGPAFCELEHLPYTWKHVIEKEALKIKELEDVLGHAPSEARRRGKRQARAFSDPMESENVSRSLFDRIFLTRTGVHFA